MRNLTWSPSNVTPAERCTVIGQRGALIWLTGLSGAGKSTIAVGLERALVDDGHVAFVLDGDNVRHGLSADLGFSDGDREENIRRVGHVAKLMVEIGIIVIAAFISPFRADRDGVRALMGDLTFIEVFIDAPLYVCEERDPKGIYRKVRAGKIPKFTGISSPYEAPENPEVVVKTSENTSAECVSTMRAQLEILGALAGLGRISVESRSKLGRISVDAEESTCAG